MKENNISCFLITKKENVRYLSNFTGTAGRILITEKDNFFITDFRYLEQVSEQCENFTIKEISSNFIDKFAEFLRSLNIKKNGF